MKDWLEIPASRVLTVVLLAALFLACGFATFLTMEQGLSWVYHAPWFFALIALLAVNTLACVVRDVTRKTVHPGFLFIHLGTLVLLAGGAWGYRTAEKGRVSIGVGETVNHFFPDWTVRDAAVTTAGETVKGSVQGIQRGAIVLFTPGKEARSIPLAELADLALDPNRPGRRFEKDRLHTKEGKPLEGLFLGVNEGSVLFEPVGGEAKGIPFEEVMFLRMGNPAIVPLGFSLHLRDFRIETYPETVETMVLLKAPGGAMKEIRPEVGAEADLGAGFRARILQFLPDAQVDGPRGLVSRSDNPNNPAVVVEVSWGEGRTERRVSFAKFPDFHGSKNESGVVVRLLSTEGMPKDYFSEVEVLEEGVPVRDALIEVNGPLTYRGYTFYQSSYSMEGGETSSVFQVVKDPGLPLAYSGCALLLVGCALTFYWKPIQAARRRAAAAAAAGPRAGSES